MECAAIGLPAGGEPFFDSVESTLAHLFFGARRRRGVSHWVYMRPGTACKCNDPYIWKNGQVTTTNHNGGVLGGLTNGMPVVCRVVIKPTASIAKEQQHRFVKAENRGNAGSKGAA